MMHLLEILNQGWFEQIIYASIVTIMIAVVSFTIGTAMGTLTAVLSFSKNSTVLFFNRIYLFFLRGVPEILIIFLLFYGGSSISVFINQLVNPEISGKIYKFLIGSVALGLICGSYLSEVFRGAFLAIPSGQLDAGISLGMNKVILFRRIIVPQIIFYAFNNITNIWLLIIKDTSLVALIGVGELMFKTNLAVSSTHMPFLFYFLTGGIYLLIAYVSYFILHKVANNFKGFKTEEEN